MFNRYGQTETTIAVTTYQLERDRLDGATSVPIGPPNPGVSFYVVNEDGRLVEEPGEVGKLNVGGRQVMAGYWRDPLTAATLRTDVVPGETLYRTGDLAYRDAVWGLLRRRPGQPDGKAVRPVRISLLEIAAALARGRAG